MNALKTSFPVGKTLEKLMDGKNRKSENWILSLIGDGIYEFSMTLAIFICKGFWAFLIEKKIKVDER